MDQEQDKHFRDAVERKKRESEAAARAPRQGPAGSEGGLGGDQENLRSPSEPQDTFSSRDKNTRHKKVTADKWNQ
jgi:hypothetical protein